MTSHTLYLTSYQHCFFHHIHCIDDIIPTLFMRSHPLYMSTSYPLYCIQEPIHYVCTITATVPVSHPHFPWYHTLCIYDIAPTICLTSDTLYKVSYPQFVSSRHIIYDITGVLFMSSLPQYITLHPQYLCPHNPSTYDLWTTVCMTSHPLYIWHLMHHTYRHIHSLSSHHCSNNITSTAFMTSHTLYTTSHTWQHKSYICHLTLYIWLHPLYLCHQTQGINCILPTLCMSLHTICMTSYSVCLISHEHFMTSLL